ncbi:hypothetical protein K437DRAFT_59061 [Tilletiaria anomala UBC 951]|uniref:Uncharacterized protein n=1 Tax=Tilletiaria anomala (strain ATCC 24038 / CBS 436.72 / UBC 951) TaxID=1037660 RepID=A0A066V7A6_TILAU|nr:uncharacterized protein K437DRAFT_59061 [Tilletiaria anomala UBC 951]KDN36168.1 hypothetical protein K437DRAFT_59061 [Tilletiaria anomala UBC 951]
MRYTEPKCASGVGKPEQFDLLGCDLARNREHRGSRVQTARILPAMRNASFLLHVLTSPWPPLCLQWRTLSRAASSSHAPMSLLKVHDAGGLQQASSHVLSLHPALSFNVPRISTLNVTPSCESCASCVAVGPNSVRRNRVEQAAITCPHLSPTAQMWPRIASYRILLADGASARLSHLHAALDPIPTP